MELFPGTILPTREATRPKTTKSPQPPNSAECALSTAEVKQLYLQSEAAAFNGICFQTPPVSFHGAVARKRLYCINVTMPDEGNPSRVNLESRYYSRLSLLKTLNAGETPGFLWLSEF